MKLCLVAAVVALMLMAGCANAANMTAKECNDEMSKTADKVAELYAKAMAERDHLNVTLGADGYEHIYKMTEASNQTKAIVDIYRTYQKVNDYDDGSGYMLKGDFMLSEDPFNYFQEDLNVWYWAEVDDDANASLCSITDPNTGHTYACKKQCSGTFIFKPDAKCIRKVMAAELKWRSDAQYCYENGYCHGADDERNLEEWGMAYGQAVTDPAGYAGAPFILPGTMSHPNDVTGNAITDEDNFSISSVKLGRFDAPEFYKQYMYFRTSTQIAALDWFYPEKGKHDAGMYWRVYGPTGQFQCEFPGQYLMPADPWSDYVVYVLDQLPNIVYAVVGLAGAITALVVGFAVLALVTGVVKAASGGIQGAFNKSI